MPENTTINFQEKVAGIIKKDLRYNKDAYEFVMQGLIFAQGKLNRKGHVTGKELSVAMKDLALEQYGPLSKTVLEHWGVKTTSDFGEIVFNMIESGLMSKTEEDTKEDFKDIYDFSSAFNVFKE